MHILSWKASTCSCISGNHNASWARSSNSWKGVKSSPAKNCNVIHLTRSRCFLLYYKNCLPQTQILRECHYCTKIWHFINRTLFQWYAECSKPHQNLALSSSSRKRTHSRCVAHQQIGLTLVVYLPENTVVVYLMNRHPALAAAYLNKSLIRTICVSLLGSWCRSSVGKRTLARFRT